MDKSWLLDSRAVFGVSFGCEAETKSRLDCSIASKAPKLEQVGINGAAVFGASLGCEAESKARLVNSTGSEVPELEEEGIEGPAAEASLSSASPTSRWEESSFKNKWEIAVIVSLLILLVFF